MKLTLEGFRVFAKRQTVEIKPLTLLVGENSAGKTSLLAALRAAFGHENEFPYDLRGLNKYPFEIGGYDSIATKNGAGKSPSGSFAIARSYLSAGWQGNRKETEIEIEGIYSERDGMPSLTKQLIRFPEKGWEIELTDLEAKISYDKKVHTFKPERPNRPALRPFFLRDFLWQFERALKTKKVKIPEELLEVFEGIPFGPSRTRVVALSPLRSKPKRTYDAVSDDFDPDGDHVPKYLAALSNAADEPSARALFKSLEQFGRVSGLFDSVEVRKLGKKASDAFQVVVKDHGRKVNLIDVGYGVSQSLPILAELLRPQHADLYLVQQPEVHLHPRAQAELGTFLSLLAAKHRGRYVVETHSDYLVDRVRLAVSKGMIPSSDVSVLYFERNKSDTTIHTITLDGKGNLLNPPKGYRDFFIREELQILGR